MPIADLAFLFIEGEAFLGNKRRIMNFPSRSGPDPERGPEE
jgi:hypothetical protein